MNFDKPPQENGEKLYLTGPERNQLMLELTVRMQGAASRGGNDVENTIMNLVRKLQQNEPILLEEAQKVLPFFGDPDNKNTNYH